MGGAVYMFQQNIPYGVLAALVIELAIFLATASPHFRLFLTRFDRILIAFLLPLLTAVTWTLAGGGELWQLAGTVAVAAFFAFWYLRFPESDWLVLIVYAILALGKASAALYLGKWSVVGEFAWLRTFLIALLLFRRPALEKFGLFPTWEEWRAGIKWWALFMPVALGVGIPIGFAKLRVLNSGAGKIAVAAGGTFLAHFLFVALREEIVFRGLLMTNLQRRMGAGAGLAVSSVLFGAAHLPFGHFPNWKFAVVAGLAGWFYGKAYESTGSVRPAMVTHALTNVVARVFLST